MQARTRIAAVAAFAVAGVASIAAAGSTTGPATVDTPAVRLDAQRKTLIVSDSAWLGIKTYGAADGVRGFDQRMDLASCRRRVSPSCRNYDGHVPITMYEEVLAHGDGYTTLVVATGYNDSDTTFAGDVDSIVRVTRSLGYDRIVWLTLRSNVSYQSPGNAGFGAVFERNNATLRSLVASGRFPEIVVADWATYARDRPEWFASDGIHLRGAGPWAAADYISRKLAAIDGRPCAMPRRAGGPIENPCRDPDAGPPAVEIEALYPVGEPSPDSGFFMEWEGESSWPDRPWWG